MADTIQLDHHQIKLLMEALLVGFPAESDLDQMLFLSTGKILTEIAPTGVGMRRTTFKVIREAQMGGWVRDLVDGAHKEKPGLPLLRRFVAEIFPKLLIQIDGEDAVVSDPLKANFLDPGRNIVFINRDGLRRGLKELVGSGVGLTPKIMSIHSELSKCGKTYSHEFIKYFAVHKGHHVAYVDLYREVMVGQGLKEFVAQLGRRLFADVSSIPVQEEQTSRWIRKLVNWLIDQINRKNQMCWLVLDSINQVPALPKEIHDFIQELAKQIDEMVNFPCRLILISYQGREQLPIEIRDKIATETIHANLGLDHIRQFFEMQVRRLLGEGSEEDHILEVATTISQSVTHTLEQLPIESRPYAISKVVRQSLVGLEGSLVEKEEAAP